MKNPPNGGFLCYIREGDGKLEVAARQMAMDRDQKFESIWLTECSVPCFSSLLVVSASFYSRETLKVFSYFYKKR